MPPTVFDALSVIADFDEALADGTKDTEERRKFFLQHLKNMDKLNFTVPHFKKGLDWLNVSEPLSLDDTLKGQLVILDFFTYCCINCMHILPDLKVVEETNPPESGVVIVGVHSAKFANEKVTANIISAVIRYGITHPVVNDSDATLWQELSVSCWPTLLFVGPSNQLLYTIVGEGHLTEILEFVEIAKEYYTSSGKLKPKSLPPQLEKNKVEKSALSFPGKIFHWPEQNWLVISDTGNHRIVVIDANGVVQESIGSGSCGFKDGTFSESNFSSPQGVVCLRDKIYVADTGNHAIRVVDMSTKTVSTIVGTGRQGVDREGGKMSTDQEIASPWDIVLGHSKNRSGDSDPDLLFIAVAGTHQIWVYFLEDAAWYKGRSYSKGTCVRFAGSGAEENRNNSYPEKAGFAQPSGLAVSTTKNRMYVADSESSSVRCINLVDGKVSAVVGGERDPTNLFASGDVDGKGVNAKLQHPLGVALLTPDGPLIVADSYNHKLKQVNLDTSTCESLSFSCDQHLDDGLVGHLSEPGGLAIDQNNGTIFVADTNNHAIKVVDYTSKTISELPIIFSKSEKLKDEVDKQNRKLQDLVPLPDITISVGNPSISLLVPLCLKEGEHMNAEAPNSFRISASDESSMSLSGLISEFNRKGNLRHSQQDKTELSIPFIADHNPGSYVFQISIHVFACLDQGDVCLPPRTLNFKQTIHVE